MATITDFQVDVIASGVAAPYGPLTRVSDMADFPVPNENHSIEFTTGLGDTAYMSYEQLSDSDVRARILHQVSGIDFRVQEMKEDIAAIYAVSNGMSAPHTYEDMQDILDVLRARLRWWQGYF